MGQVYFGNVHVITLQRQIVQLPTGNSYEVVAYGRLKTVKRKLQTFVSKKWSRSPTRSANHSDLNGKILVFWKSGGPRGLVAYERWSQGEVLTVIFSTEFRLRLSSQQGRALLCLGNRWLKEAVAW